MAGCCSLVLLAITVLSRAEWQRETDRQKRERWGERPTEDEMVGWHHRLNGHEFERTLGNSEGQGSLACCSPWSRKESDTTEKLNTTTYGNHID